MRGGGETLSLDFVLGATTTMPLVVVIFVECVVALLHSPHGVPLLPSLCLLRGNPSSPLGTDNGGSFLDFDILGRIVLELTIIGVRGSMFNVCSEV